MFAASSILIIDDEAFLRRSLTLILQSKGYLVNSAASAQAGLQMLQAGSYDLVFLDIRLPDRSGMVVLPAIRQLYPDLPVLILTAHATMETAIEAVRQGARDYLLKPIDPEQILVRIREVLEEQSQPKRRREIAGQIQSLLAELHQIETQDDSSAPILPALPPTDPGRYLQRGGLMLDLHTRHVLLDKQLVSLPPSAFDFLVTLMRHVPDPVSHKALVKESQGYDLSQIEACEITRWQIHELRKALEKDPHKPGLIITVRDVGYRLVL